MILHNIPILDKWKTEKHNKRGGNVVVIGLTDLQVTDLADMRRWNGQPPFTCNDIIIAQRSAAKKPNGAQLLNRYIETFRIFIDAPELREVLRDFREGKSLSKFNSRFPKLVHFERLF